MIQGLILIFYPKRGQSASCDAENLENNFIHDQIVYPTETIKCSPVNPQRHDLEKSKI